MYLTYSQIGFVAFLVILVITGVCWRTVRINYGEDDEPSGQPGTARPTFAVDHDGEFTPGRHHAELRPALGLEQVMWPDLEPPSAERIESAVRAIRMRGSINSREQP